MFSRFALFSLTHTKFNQTDIYSPSHFNNKLAFNMRLPWNIKLYAWRAVYPRQANLIFPPYVIVRNTQKNSAFDKWRSIFFEILYVKFVPAIYENFNKKEQ